MVMPSVQISAPQEPKSKSRWRTEKPAWPGSLDCLCISVWFSLFGLRASGFTGVCTFQENKCKQSLLPITHTECCLNSMQLNIGVFTYYLKAEFYFIKSLLFSFFEIYYKDTILQIRIFLIGLLRITIIHSFILMWLVVMSIPYFSSYECFLRRYLFRAGETALWLRVLIVLVWCPYLGFSTQIVAYNHL